MPLSIADLDKTCRHCDQPIRAHCSHAEGVYYYTPCSETLIATYPVLKECFASGVCAQCGRDAKSHFAFRSPVIGISLRGKTTDIQPSGKIVVYEVAKVIGCPTPPEQPLDS